MSPGSTPTAASAADQAHASATSATATSGQQVDNQARINPARGVLASWLYTVITFVCMFIFGAIITLGNAAQVRADEWVTVPVLGMLVGLCVGVTLMRRGLHSGLVGHPVQQAGIGLALVSSLVVFAYTLIAKPDFGMGTFPLAVTLSAVACLLPRRIGLTVIAVAVVLPILQHVLFEPTGSLLAIYMAAFFAFTLYLSMWAFNLMLQLDDARKTEKDLALARERLRFANELHDAQGHTLQVLALKTELAERLLDVDIEAAREQLRDARQLAADALANTRSIARGYRKVSLEDELRNAVDVLEAAGTTCALQIHTTPEEGPEKELIARLVREGTTNLLRHATEATQASIEVAADSSSWVVRMRNNGAAPDTLASANGSATDPIQAEATNLDRGSAAGGSGNHEPAARASASTGTGIESLRSAFREAGGEVESTLAGEEFTLTGRLPR
ncbi:sensor histidine kinase [Gulosibacter chungangensis]|uniref:Signal transduction histidine kinase subgroup 3 dimerisation and phosphoacceptor domain-containing protein n=1 Tax=Gulosibacter chungangensis TaxID=979746 RepID=A0A7J5B8N2_9MICO|nr:histidine kinase [Gulosibacter chungangensis]KAB1641681.1 hypothetical protein F8O05_12085 [Gulosibacter chungangensis]